MSTDRQRDAETDRLLRAALQPGVHAEACPGADVLAAYAEASLSPAERDSLEAHFAACHRCQEALALIARTWTATGTATTLSRRWWYLPMRWLVPLAVAAAVVMYVAVRPVIAPYFPQVASSSEVRPSPAPEHVMAEARTPEQGSMAADRGGGRAENKAPAGKSGAESGSRAGEPGGQLPGAGSAKLFAPLPKLDSRGAGRVGEVTAGGQALARGGARQDTQAKAREPLAARADDVAFPQAGVSPKPTTAMAGNARPGTPSPPAPAPAQTLPLGAMSESVVVTAPRPRLAGAAGQQLALSVAATSPRDVVSPDGSVTWRIGPGGRLSRSTDRGGTWQPQPSGVSVELLAGSAPSATVCWIVGRDATVIVTIDGAKWASRPFPERVDLVAVDATDARSAIVTTREGRRFATIDGGATWLAK